MDDMANALGNGRGDDLSRKGDDFSKFLELFPALISGIRLILH